MNFEKFTIKAQQTVQEAVNGAQRSGQQTIEPVHILRAILNKAQDVAGFLFQKQGVNPQHISQVVESDKSFAKGIWWQRSALSFKRKQSGVYPC